MAADKNIVAERATLEHVNAAPAQTWNWLRMNETALEVDVPAEVAGKLAQGATWNDLLDGQVPDEAQGLLMGAGPQATGWIDAAAAERSVIRVEAGEEREEPVVVVVAAQDADKPADRAQTTLLLEEDAKASVLVCALGTETGAGTTGSALRVICGPGAEASVDLLVAQGQGASHLDSLGALLDEDARLTLRQYVLGAQTSALGVSVELAGRKAAFEADVRYVGRDGQTVDVSHSVRHLGRKTTTDIMAAGVLTGDASKTLRATIDLVQGCKGAEGTENETLVLAGDKVVNKTLPVILCSEDDVAGNHGATIGSLSEDQLFYLACRGLAEEDATDLMVGAIVDDAAASLGPQAAEAVVSWARWSLGDEAAESAETAAELAAGRAREEA